jgi:DNA-binding GntR family transcriptional regulator
VFDVIILRLRQSFRTRKRAHDRGLYLTAYIRKYSLRDGTRLVSSGLSCQLAGRAAGRRKRRVGGSKGENVLCQSSADKFLAAYAALKALVINNQFRPNEHLEIASLSKRINIGLTPVREALIRLACEDLIELHPRRGFYAKVLTVKELAGLYELSHYLLRAIVQNETGRTPGPIDADMLLGAEWMQRDVSADARTLALERLHVGIASLSGNVQAVKIIENYNDRTHAVRRIYLEQFASAQSMTDYVLSIIKFLDAGDRQSIGRRLDQQFKAKLACVPALIKEVNCQAFSPQWTDLRRPEISREQSAIGAGETIMQR